MQYSQQPVFAYTTNPVAPGPYGAPQPQVQMYQIQQQNPPATRAYAREDGKTAISLGVVQIVVGILCIAFQSGALSIENHQRRPTAIFTSEFPGYGIWCGTLYLLAGIFGVTSGKRNAPPIIVSFLVFNILCSIMSWVQLGFASSNLGTIRTCQTQIYYTYYGYGYTAFYQVNSVSDLGCQGSTYDAWVALDSLLIILSIVEFVIAVTASSICCRALGCCCSSPPQPTYVVQQPAATSIVLHTHPTQPMMTVPVGYVNQGFSTGYQAQQPAIAVGHAQAATCTLQPMAPAATSHGHVEGGFAPPPYQELYQDMTGGPSGSANKSQSNDKVAASAPGRSYEDHASGPSRSANNASGNVYATLNVQQTYENASDYEVPHDC